MSDAELLAFMVDAERRGAIAYNDAELAQDVRGRRPLTTADPRLGNYPCLLGGGCPEVHYGPRRHHAPAGCTHDRFTWSVDALGRLRCPECEAT